MRVARERLPQTRAGLEGRARRSEQEQRARRLEERVSGALASGGVRDVGDLGRVVLRDPDVETHSELAQPDRQCGDDQERQHDRGAREAPPVCQPELAKLRHRRRRRLGAGRKRHRHREGQHHRNPGGSFWPRGRCTTAADHGVEEALHVGHHRGAEEDQESLISRCIAT
jgi:hypothetical protein